MGMNYIEQENAITLPDWEYDIKKCKKITGTRFASLCGLNPWSTPFNAWCDITKFAKIPFEETKYTTAGKVLEPKIIAYLKRQFGDRVVSPADYYQKDLSRVYDFFPDTLIFGGMWDALLLNSKGAPAAVFEIKTTRRTEDWLDHPPLYYLAQAFLYAKLLGLRKVHMVLVALKDDDYDNLESFEVDSNNCYIFSYDIYDNDVKHALLDIDDMMMLAKTLWNTYVVSGVSPRYDEKKDAELLTIIHTANIDVSEDIEVVLNQLTTVDNKLKEIEVSTGYKDLEKQKKKLAEQLKGIVVPQMQDNDKTVDFPEWKIAKSADTVKYDIDSLLVDNPELETLFAHYKTVTKGSIKITRKSSKGE